MNRKSICAHVTAVTILVSLIGTPAMAAGPGKIATGVGPIERSIQARTWTIDLHRSAVREQRPPLRMASPPKPASRKLIFGVIGLFAGIYGGAYIGQTFYPNDPDGGGAILGASVGAIAGPILGVWAASR